MTPALAREVPHARRRAPASAGPRQERGAHAGSGHDRRRCRARTPRSWCGRRSRSRRSGSSKRVDEVGGEPGRRLGHEHAVHAVRAGARARPRRPAVPNSRRARNRSSSAAVAAGSPDSAAKTRAVSSSRVVASGSWSRHARAALEHAHRRPRSSPSSSLMRASASLPASMTSSWRSGAFWMPAARFVIERHARAPPSRPAGPRWPRGPSTCRRCGRRWPWPSAPRPASRSAGRGTGSTRPRRARRRCPWPRPAAARE